MPNRRGTLIEHPSHPTPEEEQSSVGEIMDKELVEASRKAGPDARHALYSIIKGAMHRVENASSEIEETEITDSLAELLSATAAQVSLDKNLKPKDRLKKVQRLLFDGANKEVE